MLTVLTNHITTVRPNWIDNTGVDDRTKFSAVENSARFARLTLFQQSLLLREGLGRTLLKARDRRERIESRGEGGSSSETDREPVEKR